MSVSPLFQVNKYIIIALLTAFGAYPAWLYNLEAHSNAIIQLKDQVIQAKAEVARPAERERLWAKLMEIAPGYGDYQKRTERVIPMVILHPTN